MRYILLAILLFAGVYFFRRMAETSRQSKMTRVEALKMLDLPENPDENAIQDAYKNLMRRNHPDQGGSAHIASLLNQARDLLLKENENKRSRS